jgi:hypothetical protein
MHADWLVIWLVDWAGAVAVVADRLVAGLLRFLLHPGLRSLPRSVEPAQPRQVQLQETRWQRVALLQTCLMM